MDINKSIEGIHDEIVFAPLRSTLGDLAEIIGHGDDCLNVTQGTSYCTQFDPLCGVWDEATVALEMIQELYRDGQK